MRAESTHTHTPTEYLPAVVTFSLLSASLSASFAVIVLQFLSSVSVLLTFMVSYLEIRCYHSVGAG